ncbi:hypothetical protein R1flu_000514 [Riccia fluitans]|uniref:Uncharacterized protein n=1 Tax=Riccia fluitans TaxID=41844 RepID=A0ABD1Y0M4_9MARC
MYGLEIPPSEALETPTTNCGCYDNTDGEMSGTELQGVKKVVCHGAKGSPKWLTIAHIYTEDTPYGFYIQVFQSQFRGPRRLRLVDDPVLEGALEFMTASPVEAFVTLNIKKVGEDMDISVESLAFRDRGYDHVEVRMCRHSSARRLFHIVFNPLEEIIRIRVHELSDFKSVVQYDSRPRWQTDAEGRRVHVPRSLPSDSSNPEVLDESSRIQISSNSDSTDEMRKPEGYEVVGQVKLFTRGYNVANLSSAPKNSSFSPEADNFGGEGFGEDDGPASPITEDAMDADTKVKRDKVNNLQLQLAIRRCKLQTTTGMSSGKHDDRVPLIAVPSRGIRILCKKKIETAMSKTQMLLNSILRRADPSGRFQN